MKWEMIVQGSIIIIGLFVGAHFSKIAYEGHKKLGHSDLKAHTTMNHGILDISNDSIVPQIEDFKVLKDPMSGWNIYIQVSNFRFAPQRASQPHRQGEGHAHLYINGNKIARLYGNWFHISELVKGEHEIKVTLNTNDHQTMAVREQSIEKIIIKKTK